MSFIADLKNLGAKPSAVHVEAPAKPAPVYKDLKEKLKALDAVNTALNLQFKTTNSLVRLSDKIGKPMPSQSTGLPTLDWGVIQCGGLPEGRIIEIFGPESAGKTTIALQFIAQAQADGNLAAFVDAEHALDPNQAQLLGVDVKQLVISQPDSGEQALDTVIALVDSGAVSLIVVDSVAALVPRAELEGDMGDSHMGLQARLMSQAMRKLVGRCENNKCTVVFINQIREKIGVMYGSNETTTGGRALRFFASLRLDIRRKFVQGAPTDAKQVGHWMTIKAVKNKVGSPFQETDVYLDYATGIDKFGDFVKYCKDMGVIEGTGWLKFEGENIGQGLEKTKDALRANPTLMEKIKLALAKIRAAA
jgi:recombination protein RecA